MGDGREHQVAVLEFRPQLRGKGQEAQVLHDVLQGAARVQVHEIEAR